jgi:hypothetical protein
VWCFISPSASECPVGLPHWITATDARGVAHQH